MAYKIGLVKLELSQLMAAITMLWDFLYKHYTVI